MNMLTILLYEWKHFFRNPFKIVAVLLFVIAGIYGLHNGQDLYQNQIAEIEKIKEKVETDKQEYLAKYESGELTDENRPWIDMGTPFWAIWYNPTYHYKTPSPAMVYSIGQAEQYGFYKNVTFWASPYDSDMAEEIANPERLQIGTLDFTFVVLFLLPLLLLILVYNLKSSETESGFMPLIEVQSASKHKWLFTRYLFYALFTAFIITILLLYGASLTSVFSAAGDAFVQMLMYSLLNLLFWALVFYSISKSGKSILGNTLKMVGVWLVFAFIIPAIVHQSVSIAKPANLMTDFIEVRDKQQDLYANDSLFQQKLIDKFPEIVKSPVFQDSTKIDLARNRSTSAMVNELKKESIRPIEEENQKKNSMIKGTYWFNPVSFFQNKFNSITQTHYEDYQSYRNEIQALIDKRTALLVRELWNDAKVDKEKYLEYSELLSITN
jgi:ABC-2 type transport system permease protein